jgi:glycolate oxidase FAD binding subunit
MEPVSELLNQKIRAVYPSDNSPEIRAWEHLEPFQQAQLLQTGFGKTLQWVSPHTQEELAAIVVCAHQQGWRILPCGHATKLHWGGIGDEVTLVVSTERLDRLIEHAVGDLTVTVEAGISFAQLQATLAQAGQFLAIDPSYADRATMGGIVATADTNSLRHRYNSVRDMLLGISFVRSDGERVKAGGRVVKNVAGYDLMKLLTGSYGTLGIITQLTFRVYPLPQASQTVVLHGQASEMATLTQTLLSSALTPVSVDLLSSAASQKLEFGSSLSLMVRFQSLSESVAQQVDRLTELGQELGLSPMVYRETDEITLWKRAAQLMSPIAPDATIVGKIGVRSTQAIAVLDRLTTLIPTAEIIIHAGSGLGRFTVEGIRSTQLQEVRSICEAAGGFLSILQASIVLKQQVAVWGDRGNALALMQRIKHQFDPQTCLSPNRFVGGI